MKVIKLICLFLLITETTSCQQQVANKKILDKDFQEYVNLFKKVEFPFSSYDEVYAINAIGQDYVKKYICNQEPCMKDWNGYNIRYTSCYSLIPRGDFIILVHDESTDCGSIWKLSTYSLNGAKISDMEFWADKSFHGHRNDDEVSGYDVQSIIDNEYHIETKRLELYPKKWKEGNQRYTYGRYIEYQYKIESNGEIVKLSEKDHGKQKYIVGTYDPNVMPCLKLAE
ncbi:MAG: hypothetical protein K6G73_04675 [Marinilabiliaceae bacterium]|nr:hypothetical protein [Marinilabiliaceae bacterium]